MNSQIYFTRDYIYLPSSGQTVPDCNGIMIDIKTNSCQSELEGSIVNK